MIYDVLCTFGELTDEAAQNRKYAKWKAAYIHNCLKNGETPVPGRNLVSLTFISLIMSFILFVLPERPDQTNIPSSITNLHIIP